MPVTKTVPTRKEDGAGAGAGLSGIRKSQVDELGSGSEDEMNMGVGANNIIRQTSQSSPGTENIAPDQTKTRTKMRRGRKPFTARATAKAKVKPRQLAGKRISSESATNNAGAATTVKSEAPAKRPGRKPGRAALAEIENGNNEKVDGADEKEEDEDIDDLDDSAVATNAANGHVSPSAMGDQKVDSSARPTRGRKKKADKNAERQQTAEDDAAVQQGASKAPANATATLNSTRTRTGRPPRTVATTEQKAEQQREEEGDAMDIEPADQAKAESHAIQSNTTRRRSISTSRRALAESARERQRQKQRAESASDTERGGAYEAGSASLRRKLTDITNKLEDLEVQYRDLEEVGVVEAERNFDKLQKASEDKTKAANDLIASLRADLAAQKAIAAENASLKKQIAELTSKSENLSGQNKTLQASLSTSQNEIKALHAKVAATRATSATAIVPDSAVKGGGSSSSSNHHGRGNNARTVLVGSAEAAKEAQKRVLKEEFYSDLTGLLVLDVKRNEESGEDVYDCIQTGRNGTLHFYLTVAAGSSSSSSKEANGTAAGGAAAATSYEDEEFTYTPHLDASRDRDLLQILPDYLTEEICFPRSNAAKFYGRVVDCMVKKIELVDHVDE